MGLVGSFTFGSGWRQGGGKGREAGEAGVFQIGSSSHEKKEDINKSCLSSRNWKEEGLDPIRNTLEAVGLANTSYHASEHLYLLLSPKIHSRNISSIRSRICIDRPQSHSKSCAHFPFGAYTYSSARGAVVDAVCLHGCSLYYINCVSFPLYVMLLTGAVLIIMYPFV